MTDGPTGAALFAAVRLDPTDDTARAVLVDWLIENDGWTLDGLAARVRSAPDDVAPAVMACEFYARELDDRARLDHALSQVRVGWGEEGVGGPSAAAFIESENAARWRRGPDCPACGGTGWLTGDPGYHGTGPAACLSCNALGETGGLTATEEFDWDPASNVTRTRYKRTVDFRYGLLSSVFVNTIDDVLVVILDDRRRPTVAGWAQRAVRAHPFLTEFRVRNRTPAALAEMDGPEPERTGRTVWRFTSSVRAENRSDVHPHIYDRLTAHATAQAARTELARVLASVVREDSFK